MTHCLVYDAFSTRWLFGYYTTILIHIYVVSVQVTSSRFLFIYLFREILPMPPDLAIYLPLAATSHTDATAAGTEQPIASPGEKGPLAAINHTSRVHYMKLKTQMSISIQDS